MNSILILGDCQSNGNNCLADEILNDSAPRTWSLRYHKEFGSAFKWFLKHRIANNVRDELPKGNLESAVWSYIREQELKTAWPNLLSIPTVTNRSLNGAHFVGYQWRLKRHLEQFGKPDHVLITDFTFPHIVSAFKFNGKQYLFEKSPNYGDNEWNPDDYPLEVHQELVKRMTFQLVQNRDWYVRKHTKGFNQLVKFMQFHQLNWTVVRFGDIQQENIDVFDKIMGRGIDCIPLFQRYIGTQGENSTNKLQTQQDIALHIQQYLDNI